MITTIRINNWLLALITLLALTIFAGSQILVSPSHPFTDDNGDGIDDFEQNAGIYQDPHEKAKHYGVTFPISELGGCADYSSCRTYCEDPVNAESCISFAKSKGFHQDEPDTKIQEVLTRARTSLGCDSEASCRNFCEVPANYDKCSNFARSSGVVGGYVEDPTKNQDILSRAQTVLGCTSADSCQSFCEQEGNRDKCAQFATQTGLHGGEVRVGPGGCTSQSTCQSFCSDPNNFQICSGFAGTSGGTFSGPGGCNSEASCRSHCEQNPGECGYGGRGGLGGPPPGYNPQEMCNRTPNCSWAGNTCQCGFYGETQESSKKAGEYAGFCSANPDKCKPGETGGFGSQEQRQEFENFCRQNPDKCAPQPNVSPAPIVGTDPASECSKYGCTWTGSSCQCTGINPQPTYTPPSSYTGPTGSYPQPTGGYTPPSSYTQPTGGPYTPPSSYNYPQPTGGYTPPSSYQTQPPPPPSSYESQPPPPPSSYSPPSSYEPPPPPSSYSPPSSYEPPPPPSSYTQGAATQQKGLLYEFLNLLFRR